MTTPGERETELLELYSDELGTPDVWRDRAIADAREQDRIAAVWEERADADEDDDADDEEFEL